MQGEFKVINVSVSGENHGEDVEVGIGLKLKGIIDQDFATRFSFGSPTGTYPEDITGTLVEFLWIGDNPTFPGFGDIPTKGKFDVDAEVDGIKLPGAYVNKAKLLPTAKKGEFMATFQLYISNISDDELKAELCNLIKQTVNAEFKSTTQTTV